MPYYKLYYHFVWTRLCRYPFLIDSRREEVYGSIIAKAGKLGGYVHVVNGMDDHVHLVTTVPPSIALATFIGQIKGASSHLVNSLARTYSNEPFAWQEEYGVLSFSEHDLPAVVRYVQTQQQHHAMNRLNKRLEQCE